MSLYQHTCILLYVEAWDSFVRGLYDNLVPWAPGSGHFISL